MYLVSEKATFKFKKKNIFGYKVNKKKHSEIKPFGEK